MTTKIERFTELVQLLQEQGGLYQDQMEELQSYLDLMDKMAPEKFKAIDINDYVSSIHYNHKDIK
jgi:hypothetical protein